LFPASRFIYKKRKTARTENPANSRTKVLWTTLIQQDYIGICLLVAGICLFLLPISLEQGGVSAYRSARVTAPTVVGFLLFILFGVWEVFFASHTITPRQLLMNRTIMGALCGEFDHPSKSMSLMTLANMFQYISFVVALTCFYTYILVCSKISISNGTYIAHANSLVAQSMGLVYGFLVAGFKQPKWFYMGGAAIALLGKELHYAFMDPQKHLAGLIVSQIIFGVGFRNNIQALTIAQAEAASSQGQIAVRNLLLLRTIFF
jgi:hypothetical protein